MEQFVLGIFQEHLSKFIIGFRKEQVNANLLNGKGSIQDILLNCSVLNEHVRKVAAPYVEFERVHVSHLSFKVSSWTNIRQSPILISLGHITAVLNEPRRDVPTTTPPGTTGGSTPTAFQQQSRRPKVRQVTARELQTLVDTKVLPKPRTSAYNLLDRILDNVTIELQSISVTFSPLGKQQRQQLWTPPPPPAIRLQLHDIRLVSVNEHGKEGSPDDVWRHNHASRRNHPHRSGGAASSVWIYKKISCEYKVSLVVRRRRRQYSPDEESAVTADTNPMPVTANLEPCDDDDEIEIEILLVSSTPLRIRRGAASASVSSSNRNMAHCFPETKLEIQLAYQRRLRTSEFVKVQLDATIPRVELELMASTIPLMVQLLVALHHCLVQQQAYDRRGTAADSVTEAGTTEPHGSNHSAAAAAAADDTAEEPIDDKSTLMRQTTPDDVTATLIVDSNSNRRMDAVDEEAIATVDSGETNSTVASEEIPSAENPPRTLLDSPSLLDLALEDGMSEASEEDGMYYQSHDAGSSNDDDDLNDPSENDEGGVIEDVNNTPVIHGSEERESAETPTTTAVPAAVPSVATFSTLRRPATHQERPKLVFPNGWIIHEKLSVRVSIHKATIFGIYTKAKDGDGQLEITLKGVVAEALWPTVTNEKGGYIQASLSYVCIQDLYAQRLRTVLTGGACAETKLPFDTVSSIPLDELNSDESFPFFEHRNVRPDPIGLAPTLSSEALGVKLTVNIRKKAQSEYSTAVDDEVMLLCEIGLDQVELVLDASPLCRIAQFALNVDGGGFDPRCFSGDNGFCVTNDIQSEPVSLDKSSLASTLFQLLDSINATVRATNVTAKVPALISESLRSCDIIVRSSEVVLTISSALPRTLFTENDSSQPESLEFPNDPSDDVCNFDSIDDASASQVDTLAITFRCQQKIKGLTCQMVPVFASFLSQQLVLSTDLTVLLCLEAAASEQSIKVGSTRVVSLLSIVVYRMNVNLDFDGLAAMLTTLRIQRNTLQKSVFLAEALTGPHEGQILPLETDVSQWTTLPHRRQLWSVLTSLEIETNLLRVACYLRVADFRMCHWLNTALIPPSVSGLAVPLFESSLSDLEVHLHNAVSSDDCHCLIKVCIAELDFRVGNFWDTSRGDEMIPVFDCSASKRQHALIVRLDEMQRNTRTWALSAELVDGTLHCHLEELVSFFSIACDAYSTSFLNEMLKNQAVNFVTDLDATIVDEIDSSELRTTINSLVLSLTTVVDVVLVRLSLNDFRICIPTASKQDSAFCGIELRVWDLEFLASFFASDGVESSDVVDVITLQRERWPSIVSNCRKGLRHKLMSSQSLLVLSPDVEAMERSLTDTFDFSSSCGEMHPPVDDPVRAVQESEDVAEALFHVVRWGREVLSKAGRVNANLFNVPSPGARSSSESSSRSASFRLMKGWMRSLRDKLSEQNSLMATILASRNAEIDALRMSLFVKENERVAALALVSSEASGWLRLASLSQSSQRSIASCVFWPHWTVLRGSLLILYAGPGQCRVLGIISLRDASLHDLEGGQRNVDLKRAFAVADHSGTLHFAIAESDVEFIAWVVAVKRAVNCFSTIDATPESDERNLTESTDAPANGTAESEICISTLDQPLTMAETGTDETAHILSASDFCQSSSETDSDIVTGGNNDHGKQLLRNRFANVRQATKSRLESAISAAKQKSIEVAAKGKEIVHKGRDVANNGNLEGSYAVSSPVVTQSNAMWPCGSCTYLNAASESKCEMCGSERPLESRTGNQNQASSHAYDKEDRTSRTEDGSTDLSSIGEDTAVSQENCAASAIVDRNLTGRSVGMKQRFGAVVRRAMATPDNPRLLTMRRQESSDNLPAGGPSSIKLHKIAIDGPLQTPKHPFIANGLESSGVILKRLQGSRIIRVHIHAPNICKTGRVDDKYPSGGGPKLLSTEQCELPSADTSAGFVDQPGITGRAHTVLTHETASRLADTTFRLEIWEYTVDTTVATVTSTLFKRLPDILSLHTALSESIAQIPSYLFDPDLKLSIGRNDETVRDMVSLDLVRTSGTVLRGLLEESNQTVTNYHADCISSFLNAMVVAPLPIDILAGFTGFLQLNDAFTRKATDEVDSQASCSTLSTNDQNQALARHASDMDQLSAMCELELKRAERHWIANDEHITNTIPTSRNATAKSTQKTSQMSLRDPVHSALLRVMEERDQIHSRMVSEQVLHVYENEANAEECARRSSELEALTLENTKNSPKPRLEKKSLTTVVAPKVQRHIQHDSDAELLSLCQQLAGEISARTAASLEVIRLQESHALEREHDALEIQALSDQVARFEHERTEQRIEVQALGKERDRWRVAYEEAMMQLEDAKQREADSTQEETLLASSN